MVNATCGVPVAVTASWNPTWTSIVSPAPYVSPLTGLLAIATALTAGAVAVLPSILWFAAFVIARLPSPRVALVPAPLWIVPPFSAKALAAILRPSLSVSAVCTV